MKKVLLGLMMLAAAPQLSFSAQVSGMLREKYTEIPVTGAAIIVKGKSSAVKSDENGKFIIEMEENDGLKIIKKGFKMLEVTPSAVSISIEMEKEDTLYAAPVKITAKKEELIQNEASKTVITGEELKSVPQAAMFSDITNAVATLPGVARSGEFSSLLYIRGGEPYEVLSVLNGLPILNPYRWGGRTTLFNNELVKNVSLYSGGFGAKYPEAASGVLDVEYREGGMEKHSGSLSMGAETVLTADGPMPGEGNYLLSYRRTFYDIFVNQSSKREDTKVKYPYFEDIYLQDSHKLGKRDFLKGWILASNEGMNYYMADDDKENKNAKGDEKFEYQSLNTIGAVEWRHLLDSNSHTKVILAYSDQQIPKLEMDVAMAKQNIKVHQGTFTGIGEYNLKYNQSKNNFRAGAGTVVVHLNDLDINANVKMYNRAKGEFEEKTVVTNIDDVETKTIGVNFGYLENEFKMDSLSITPGLSVLHNGLAEKNRVSPDPRLAVKYELDPKTVLKFATGQYSMHALEYSIAKDNPEIKPEKTIHYVAGMEKELYSDYRIRVEGYYKDMRELLVNDPEDENGSSSGEYKYIYKNIGKGFSEGVELFLQKKGSEQAKVDGWISYTYALTKKNNNSKYNTDWYYPAQDQRHTLNLTVNYKLINTKKYSLILRNKVDYHSGRPYQDFDIVKVPLKKEDGTTEDVYISLPKTDTFARFPGYFRWDTSLESTNHYKYIDFTSFIQLMNVTDNKNVESYSVSLYKGTRDEIIGFRRMIFGGFKISY